MIRESYIDRSLSQDWARAVLDVPVPSAADVSHVTDILHRVGREAYNDDRLRRMMLDPPTVMGVEKIEVGWDGPAGPADHESRLEAQFLQPHAHPVAVDRPVPRAAAEPVTHASRVDHAQPITVRDGAYAEPVAVGRVGDAVSAQDSPARSARAGVAPLPAVPEK